MEPIANTASMTMLYTFKETASSFRFETRVLLSFAL